MMLIKATFVVITIASAITRHADLRDNYFSNRRLNKLKTDRAKVLEVNLPKDSEYLDGIAHYKKQDLSLKDIEKVTAIENDFRRLVAMRGVKYVYKRNLHWRTWRKVKIDNGVTKIVSYKCNNNIRKNSTGCDNCGSWVNVSNFNIFIYFYFKSDLRDFLIFLRNHLWDYRFSQI